MIHIKKKFFLIFTLFIIVSYLLSLFFFSIFVFPSFSAFCGFN